MSKPKYLLDVNVLIALTQPEQLHYLTVTALFDSHALDWGICAFSEAGFLRISANPAVGNLTVDDANKLLAGLAERPGYRYWPIASSWSTLAAPFQQRVLGHQQITDAYLLGLAIREDGVLVTLDKKIRYLAGPQYSKNVLVLD